MAIGYVLISTTPVRERQVFHDLSKISAIKELHSLFGEYDLIAKVEEDDQEKIGKVVIDLIRQIDGVIDTKTLTCLKLQ